MLQTLKMFSYVPKTNSYTTQLITKNKSASESGTFITLPNHKNSLSAFLLYIFSD